MDPTANKTRFLYLNPYLTRCTSSGDLDHDGDIDLAIQWTRFDPYYSGNYIQILKNDGTGKFNDITDSINRSFDRSQRKRLLRTLAANRC